MINWIGEVLCNFGYGHFTREFLTPVLKDVKLIPNENYVAQENKITEGPWVEAVQRSMMKKEADVSVHFSIPAYYQPRPDKFDIGMSLWDTDCYPKEWMQQMSRMDAFLVPSDKMKQAILKTGLKKPVEVFTPHLETSKWIGTETTSVAGTENHVKFFFDGNWVASNDFESLIIGYCIAFEGINDVSLIIKTSTKDDINAKNHVLNAVRSICARLKLQGKPNIVVLLENMNEEDTCKVIRGCHQYISVAKAESIDLGKVRAACCGLPIASLEDDGLTTKLIPSTREPVIGHNAPFYGHYQNWKKVDMYSYIQTMREVYTEVKKDRNVWESGGLTRAAQAKTGYMSTNIIDVATQLAATNNEQIQKAQEGKNIIDQVVRKVTQ